MVKITGAERHSQRLKAMTDPAVQDDVFKALFVAGNIIQVEAQRSITSGAVSGANHVPSAPGAAPNADTHALDTQIETTGDRANMRVYVTSNDPKSRFLEEGTSKMAARPFMGPAARKKRGEASELVSKALSRAIRRGAPSG